MSTYLLVSIHNSHAMKIYRSPSEWDSLWNSRWSAEWHLEGHREHRKDGYCNWSWWHTRSLGSLGTSLLVCNPRDQRGRQNVPNQRKMELSNRDYRHLWHIRPCSCRVHLLYYRLKWLEHEPVGRSLPRQREYKIISKTESFNEESVMKVYLGSKFAVSSQYQNDICLREGFRDITAINVLWNAESSRNGLWGSYLLVGEENTSILSIDLDI